MSRTALAALIILALTASLACSLGGALTADEGAEVETEGGGEGEPSDGQSEPKPAGEEGAPTGAGHDGLKLVFIHHSSGENWLSDENGGLGPALMEHGYFVSDTNYDWGPSISDL